MTPPNLTRSAVALTLASLLALSGCARRGPEFADVEGTVTLNHKPLVDVEILFMPDIKEKGDDRPATSSYTDDQGHFRLWCQSAGVQGARIGMYRVCVRDIAAMPMPPLELEGGAKPYRPQPLRVPSRYSDAQQTPFKDVEIRSGHQNLEFDVKGFQR